MAGKKPPKTEPVGLSKTLREAYGWIEELLTTVKEAAIEKRRAKERANGKKLSEEELKEVADELEDIQLKLNPLENRREELVEQILGHWGHTGLEEVEGSDGKKTLISTSFQCCIEPDLIKKNLSDAQWLKVTKRVLQSGALLVEATASQDLRAHVAKALKVRQLRISVTAPSSRRPKSGETDGGEEE